MSAMGIDIGGSSVKGAVIESGRMIASARSSMYRQPGVEDVRAAVQDVVNQLGGIPAARGNGSARVGLCLPGVFDDAGKFVSVSVNLPAIVGVRIAEYLPGAVQAVVSSDATAAAFDVWASDRARYSARLVGISMGTGVGSAVLDDGEFLGVTGRSSGHIGQVDVSIESDPSRVPVGSDGGRGSLEAYVGLNSLRARFPDLTPERIGEISIDDPAMRALVRAVRIVHAMYRPEHVVLLGGVGIRLRGLLGPLKAAVSDGLTSLARPGWSLTCGEHDFHAACGAARRSIVQQA